MNSIKNYALIVLAVLVVTIYIVKDCQVQNLEKDMFKLAQQDSTLHVYNDSLAMRIAKQVADFNVERDKWKSIIDAKTETITELEEAMIDIKPVKIIKSYGVDTVYIDGEKNYRVNIFKETDLIKVSGYTIAPYDSVNIDIDTKPFTIEVAVTEDKHGIKKSYIRSSSKEVKISDWTFKYTKTEEKKPLFRLGGMLGVAPVNKDLSFIAGGNIHIRGIPLGLGVLGVSNKGIGPYITYP